MNLVTNSSTCKVKIVYIKTVIVPLMFYVPKFVISLTVKAFLLLT